MNVMISELNITRFRGIHDLMLTNLGQINVLAGVNNSGKTTILEAIGLLSNPLDRSNFLKWILMRVAHNPLLNKKMADYIEFLFTDNQAIQISATLSGQKSSITYSASSYMKGNASGTEYKSIEVTANAAVGEKTERESFSFRNDGRSSYKGKKRQFRTEYIAINSNFYQNCVQYISDSMLNQKKQLLLNVIQSFDPDITDIMLKNDDILIDSKSAGVQPLFNYGSGMQKAVLLAATMLAATGNVILVDEIDSTINLSAFREVFPWFVRKCRELNIQAFITTHSLEAIDAILDAGKDAAQDDIRMITLRRLPKSHRIVAQIRTGSEARYDREDFEMEMRI